MTKYSWVVSALLAAAIVPAAHANNNWSPYTNAPTMWANGITGAGQIIGILDTDNVDTNNTLISPRVALRADLTGTGISVGSHPTESAGVAANTNNGIAKGAFIYSIKYGTTTTTDAQDTTGILRALWLYGQGVGYNAGIWNLSAQLAGGTTANNGSSQLALGLDYMTDTYDLVFTKSSGNNNAITAPGDAFNIITTGATGQNNDPNTNYALVSTFSGSGRLGDGRSKPDITAPGFQITTPTQTPAGPPAATTSTVDGTSYAAPDLAGGAALVRQLGSSIGNLTDHRVVKAVLLNASDKDGGDKTAEKAFADKAGNAWLPPTPGTAPLDRQMGSGQVNYAAARTQYNRPEIQSGFIPAGTINNVDPISWDYNNIEAGALVDYAIDRPLKAGTKLTATIDWDRIVTWTDSAASGIVGSPDFADMFTARGLDNLDLTLLDKNGNELNAFDAQGRASFSKSLVDSVEHIYFTIPTTGDYTVRVMSTGGADSFGTNYGFALWSTPVPEPATIGLFTIAILIIVGRRRYKSAPTCGDS
jgi:Subtilase family/Bacterial pre-peptidase C-terminal domain/PEP-CTERM motif